jgi:hypothetical protein
VKTQESNMNTSTTELLTRYGYQLRFSLPLHEFEQWVERNLIVETFDDDGNPIRSLAHPVQWGHDDWEEREQARKERCFKEGKLYVGPAPRRK